MDFRRHRIIDSNAEFWHKKSFNDLILEKRHDLIKDLIDMGYKPGAPMFRKVQSIYGTS